MRGEGMKDGQGESMHMFLSVHTLNRQHNHFLGIPFERQRELVCARGREKERKSKGHGIHCLRDKTLLRRPDTYHVILTMCARLCC